MKSKRIIPLVLSTIVFAHLTSPNAHGQNLSWDSNGITVGSGETPTGTWGVDPFWNATGTGDVTDPTNATTNLGNDVFFSAGTDGVNPYTVTVSGTQSARSIAFQDGAPTLSGGSIILGTGGGLTVNSTAAVAGAVVTSNVTISGRTSFAIGAGPPVRTLNLNGGTFTRNPGAVLLVTSGGILKSTMTNFSSNTNGVAAPWAFYLVSGASGSTRYATFSGADVLPLTGTAAATAANVTDTTGIENYDLAAAGTLGANASVNTLRYSGIADTLTTSGSFKLNGLLNNTPNALTIAGNVTIGNTNELVVNNVAPTGTAGVITFSGAIGDNGANASSVTKTGAGTLTLSAGNTYSGNTTIVGSSGGIVVSANNALGSTAGTTTVVPFGGGGNSLGFSGGVNYSTAETIIGSGVGSATALAGTFTAVQRGFVQSVSGNNTFAGAIQINAGGISRIGTQDSAKLTLSGPITMASGTTGVTVVFRGGTTNDDYVTLSNSGNSWDTETLIFTSNTGTGAGVRLGVNNGLPTAIPLGGTSGSASGTTFDLAGFNQEINGLSNTTGGTSLRITNSVAATTSVLTLNTSANRVCNSGGVIVDGAGVVQVVKKGLADQNLQAAHTYTGGTHIMAGSITITGGDDRLPVAGTLTLGGTGTTGKLALGIAGFPRNQTLAGLVTSGDGGNVVGSDPAIDTVLTLNIATTNTFGGTLGGAGANENELAVVKGGSGILTLTGTNTYIGNTTVNVGSLVLADNAQLRFLLGATSGVNNAISGAGLVTLNGDFSIDTTAADALETGSWTLENVASLSGPYESTFTVVGFTNAGGDKWTKSNGPTKQYTFDETTGILTLGPAPIGGFSAWQSANLTGGGVQDDHDNDGVANGVEWFLGGNGNTTGFTALPGVTRIVDTLSVTWVRHPDFLGVYGTDFVVETSPTLTNPWTAATLGMGADKVEITGNNIKYTFAAGARNFARLKIIKP